MCAGGQSDGANAVMGRYWAFVGFSDGGNLAAVCQPANPCQVKMRYVDSSAFEGL